MFKHKFKISGSHNLSSKDKKKLKQGLVKFSYEPACVDAFLDDKLFEEVPLAISKL